MNTMMATMLNHASVRQFTEQAVSQETLENIIRCGQAAASSSFIQAVSVIQVTQAETRAQIAELAGGQTWVAVAPVFLVFCADLQRVNYACVKNELGALEGHTEHFITATVDTALVAQNVLLAAESMGLGGVFIGGIRNNPQLVCDLLKLPEQVYPVFGMCLGWPVQANAVKPRFPVQTILHTDHYDLSQVASQVDAYDLQMQAYYQTRGSNQRISNWSAQTAGAVQKKQRPHMLKFLQARGLLLR
ncbi:oxygen-insensitive NADPH nitroreductase [uncultured Thiothrix sp.]|uniref:oxygen-insensitive NADPH nitroreductase n=1 Tax=uncultured Thiothrix sp. TaxID=223185 RepID=UPI0026059D86|nr:oxygen-insensitive NADPH nitroreductase [uncultured Thiothrix sp.]